jgi:hypothetical protein
MNNHDQPEPLPPLQRDPEDYSWFADYKNLYYEQKDKSALIHAAALCIWHNIRAPAWLRQAFMDASQAAYEYKIKSWEEVFGRPVKKGKRLAMERRNMKITFPICRRINDLRKAGKPLDKSLFSKVGKEFGVSGTVAAELYYREMHEALD